MQVDFSILNQKETPAIYADALAQRPSPGFAGRLFVDTDSPSTGIYRDTGNTWELISGAALSTPNLQQVTDVGNTTTQNVIVQGRGTYGGASIQNNYRLFVRDVGTYTNQYNALSIFKDITYNSSANIVNGPAYGSIGAVDTLNQTANITFPNGVSCATGVFSTVVVRPDGYNITQNQAAGLRALSAYRTQFTIEQNSATNSTISHFAHYFATSIYKLTNSNPVTITNNYGVAISDQTEQTTGLTIINRFGVAQFGTNDRNFFLGRVSIGTTTDAGYQLDVNSTGRIINATMGMASTGGQSLKVVASTADIGVNAFSVTNELETVNYLRIRSGDGATFFTTIVQIGSIRLTSQNIDIPTDTPTAADATITLKAGNQNNGNRAGGNLFLQGGAAAGAGDGINGFISFGISNFTAPSGTTNTISEVARFSINKNLLIGTTNDVASAKLQVVSTTQGFLPPVMTAAQRNLINSPANGLIVYDTTFQQPYVYNGTAWLPFVTTKQLNYFVGHASSPAYADAQTYYFGSAPGQPVQTSQGLVRCNVNQTGIITSVYLFIRSAVTPSNEPINISLFTANGTGVMQIVASLNFAFSGSSPLLCVNWTGLNVVINAGDTFEFQINTNTMAVNPNNVILSGNVLINY